MKFFRSPFQNFKGECLSEPKCFVLKAPALGTRAKINPNWILACLLGSRKLLLCAIQWNAIWVCLHYAVSKGDHRKNNTRTPCLNRCSFVKSIGFGTVSSTSFERSKQYADVKVIHCLFFMCVIPIFRFPEFEWFIAVSKSLSLRGLCRSGCTKNSRSKFLCTLIFAEDSNHQHCWLSILSDLTPTGDVDAVLTIEPVWDTNSAD